MEEVFQSLRENAFDAAREMQQQVVARSITQLKQKNAHTQRQLQALRQKVGGGSLEDPWWRHDRLTRLSLWQLIEYDSVRRSAESQRKNAPEFERAQQRVQATEATLVAMTNGINADLNAIDTRRSVDMRNELLAVVASQVSRLLARASRGAIFYLMTWGFAGIPALAGTRAPPAVAAGTSRHCQAFDVTRGALARAAASESRHRSGHGRAQLHWRSKSWACWCAGGLRVNANAGGNGRGECAPDPHEATIRRTPACLERLAVSILTLLLWCEQEMHFAEKLAVATYGRH